MTITGSGFGSAQGSGQVWLGTATGVVNSWSDGQVVAAVATGSNSGSAQILQNGVWTNSVDFTITGKPQITGITPTTGGSGTVVTIQGTGFGSSQGSGTALIGGAPALVTDGATPQVSVSVASNAASGVTKIQQGGVWSNAVTFTVPSSNPVTLNPNLMNMVVGETRPITALGLTGQPVTGLTWTSSDTTVVTLSTDDPPIITAVAPGNITVNAGGASADVTVYSGSLPAGTILWSNPGDGSGIQENGIMPAVPSDTGVADVFALQNDGTVEATTSDGAVAWTATVPSNAITFLPDFQGGLVAFSFYSISRLDGLTGVAYPAYNGGRSEDGLGYPAIHTDGTIFAIDYTRSPNNGGTDTTDSAFVVGIDPSTGEAKFKVPGSELSEWGMVSYHRGPRTR